MALYFLYEDKSKFDPNNFDDNLNENLNDYYFIQPPAKKSKKKLSSPKVFTGRLLVWIELFFIQKQKMTRMNKCTTHSTVSYKFENRRAKSK